MDLFQLITVLGMFEPGARSLGSYTAEWDGAGGQ